MPTEEFRKFLDREFSKAAVKPITDLASPLLQELVNSGLMAFRRCEVEAAEKNRPNEDVAAFVLFRHIIEMADGVEVLVSNSCGTAAIPTLRAEFEASLSLSYLLESSDDYVRRSLSWLCGHIHNAIEAREKLDPGTPKGKDYAELYDKDFAGVAEKLTDKAPNKALADEVDALKRMLQGEQLASVEAEYARLSVKRRFPEWFSLFGGPPNRAELALRLGRGAEYRFLYGDYSGVAHGTDVSRYITRLKGQAAYDAVRRPDELQQVAALAALFLIRAIRQMIGQFRRGENLERWYVREVRPLLRQLIDLRLEFKALPEV
jgi:hypothetical protein